MRRELDLNIASSGHRIRADLVSGFDQLLGRRLVNRRNSYIKMRSQQKAPRIVGAQRYLIHDPNLVRIRLGVGATCMIAPVKQAA